MKSQLQFCELTLKKPFKVFMKEEWGKCIMDTDEHQWTPEGSVVWLTVVQA
jgi:hypothetical protein